MFGSGRYFRCKTVIFFFSLRTDHITLARQLLGYWASVTVTSRCSTAFEHQICEIRICNTTPLTYAYLISHE